MRGIFSLVYMGTKEVTTRKGETFSQQMFYDEDSGDSVSASFEEAAQAKIEKIKPRSDVKVDGNHYFNAAGYEKFHIYDIKEESQLRAAATN